jgi:hypothetical protein
MFTQTLLVPTVGASLLAKNPRAARGVRFNALSLATIASELAPMYGLAPHCLPAFEKLSPRCIYVSGLFAEAVVGFWPKLEKLVVCRLQSGLEGQ